MKKKIAIVTRQMIAGGIEKALISMLETCSPKDYEITLFLMGCGGDFLNDVPSWVKIKYVFGDEKTVLEKIMNDFKSGHLFSNLRVLYFTIKRKMTNSIFKQEKYLAKIMPKVKEEYDIAISYHVPASFPVIYVAEHLIAKQKFAWIHSDVEFYKKEMLKYEKFYSKFNKIYCVSKYGKNKFDAQYPHYKNKTEVFYNLVNKEKIILQSNVAKVYPQNDKIKILTVGRLTVEKGIDIIPNIIEELLKNKIENFEWYIIGGGDLNDVIKKKIKDMNLEDKVFLLGNQNNPYPYFKGCDIYVQPSRHEGYCLTLAEAILFCKPIVTTDFTGALEQINNNSTGFITKFDIGELSKQIAKLIKDDEIKFKFQKNLNFELESKVANQKSRKL